MKKFFYLSVLAFAFVSCSTDNDVTLQEEAIVISTIDEFNEKAGTPIISNCISYVYGEAAVDVSQGINNPKVVFIADVPNGSSSKAGSYKVSLELQSLSDCEDMESGAGSIVRHTINSFVIPSVTDPSIKLALNQLPTTCYKWRFVIEGYMNGGLITTPCINSTEWYDAPLF